MRKFTLPAGQIIKVGALPFTLIEPTLVEGSEGNYKLLTNSTEFSDVPPAQPAKSAGGADLVKRQRDYYLEVLEGLRDETDLRNIRGTIQHALENEPA